MYGIITVVTVVAALVVAVVLRQRAVQVSGCAAECSCFPFVERLVAVGVWCCFWGLAITGNGWALRGQALTGYVLLLHVSMGMLLACSLSVLLLLKGAATFEADSPVELTSFSVVLKVSLWLFAAGVLVLLCSVLAAMLRVLGTDLQHTALAIHRSAALLSLAAGIVYAVSSFRVEAGRVSS